MRTHDQGHDFEPVSAHYSNDKFECALCGQKATAQEMADGTFSWLNCPVQQWRDLNEGRECECGALVGSGIKRFAKGHSGWCPVREKR